MTHGPARLRGWTWAYVVLVALCLATLWSAGDLHTGRDPWRNLARTLGDFVPPSFVDAWVGNPRLEFRSDDGTLLRVEDRRVVEQTYLLGLAQIGRASCRERV